MTAQSVAAKSHFVIKPNSRRRFFRSRANSFASWYLFSIFSQCFAHDPLQLAWNVGRMSLQGYGLGGQYRCQNVTATLSFKRYPPSGKFIEYYPKTPDVGLCTNLKNPAPVQETCTWPCP